MIKNMLVVRVSHTGNNVFLWMLRAAGETRRCLLGKIGISISIYYLIIIFIKLKTNRFEWYERTLIQKIKQNLHSIVFFA